MALSEYFSLDELACKHCGTRGFNYENLPLLDAIREECGFPFILSSAYRCPQHPAEKNKTSVLLGEHAQGDAVDVLCYGNDAYKLVEVAIAHGVTRIGISQRGEHSKRFIHLGFSKHKPRFMIWSY